MKKTGKKNAKEHEDDGSQSSEYCAPQGDQMPEKEKKGGKDKDKKKTKQSNTIIQQINGMSMTPMNDQLAEKTIEDHKYLLELIENRVAIAYFACANRNQSLFHALKRFVEAENLDKKIDSQNEDGDAHKEEHGK